MASKKFEKGSPEWLMFQDYWKLCQQFWEPEDNDEYWEGVIMATNEFYEKHNGIDKTFVKQIALGYIESLDRKCGKR